MSHQRHRYRNGPLGRGKTVCALYEAIGILPLPSGLTTLVPGNLDDVDSRVSFLQHENASDY